MPFPNFIVAGVQKCGTHWISSNLRKHPQVFIPKNELHFFDNDQNYSKGNIWYGKYFAGKGHFKAIGERTPNYLTAYKASERMKTLIPAARLIVTLRNPIDRAISALYHHIVQKRYSLWIDVENQLLRLLSKDEDDRYGVLTFGRYSDYLEHYRELFSHNQFLFLVFEEDILRNTETTLINICQFLDIESNFTFPCTEKIENKGVKKRLGLLLSRIRVFDRRVGYRAGLMFERFAPNIKPVISDETRSRLFEYFQLGIEKLEGIINRNLSCWKR